MHTTDAIDWARWAAYIRPSPDERRWQTIPWRSTFSGAVSEAARRQMPLLLWAMNGHPLACT